MPDLCIQFIAEILLLFYKIMNSSLNHQSLFPNPSPFFGIEPSPYLSPLIGSISNMQQSSHDELNDFHLEDQPAFQIGGELDQNSLDASFSQILLKPLQLQPCGTIATEAIIPLKHEIQTPYIIPSANKSRVQYILPQCSQIINFISSNDHLTQSDLLSFGKPLYQNSDQMEFVFRTLLGKFLKLRKTKEEMIKYCMRKAFKFIGDSKKDKSGKSKKQKGDKRISNDPLFSMPFRKNSSQKTMNSQYLKQVFSNPEFLTYYKQFLNSIEEIIEEDNNSKILYLSDSIEKLLSSNSLGEIEKIKRLPWNRTILKRTSDLAKTLIEFASQGAEIHFNQNELQRNSDHIQQSN